MRGIYPLPPIIFTKTYNFSKVYDFLKRTCTSYVQTIVFSPKKYMNNELEFVIKPLKSVIFKTQAHWPRKSIYVSLKDIANYNYMHSQLFKINNCLYTSAYLMFCQRRCCIFIFNDIWCITLGLSHLQDINRVFPLTGVSMENFLEEIWNIGTIT